jgi:hypothetical protein
MATQSYRLVLAAAGALITGSAHGALPTWKLIETPDQAPYKLYLDTANLERDGAERLFMAKMVPADPSDPAQDSGLSSVIVKVKIDCRANTIETEAASMTDQAGDVSDLNGDPPRPIERGTDDMNLRTMVC